VLSPIHILYNSLQQALSLFSLLCLHQSLPGNGFQRWMFPLLWVPKLLPCLSCQLLTATAHKDWTAAALTNQLTPLYSTALHSTNTLTELNLVGWVKLPQSGPTENTTCNISSTVAWCHCRGDMFLCCKCMGHYLAMGLHATILWQDWITWQQISSVVTQWHSKHAIMSSNKQAIATQWINMCQ
jgi:hypothetical protein